MSEINPFPSDAIYRFERLTRSKQSNGNGDHWRNGTGPEPEPYKLRGSSATDYAAKPIEPRSCILGDRYLTRRSGMFFVAPSGQGKSTAVMQAMVCWACGRECFEIQPDRPLRIVLIQAEDDDADLSDMAKVIEHLKFASVECKLIAQNTWIETVNDKIGLEAIGIIDEILEQRPCDLLILNPYTAYLGASIMDDEANSLFLRGHLQRLANKHNCALFVPHHTPKTNFRHRTEKWSVMDWMYSGAGAAVLTNWARAILAIDPLGESGVFKFIAAKRGKRIGWEENVNYFRHDPRPGVLLWTKATATEIAAATISKARQGVSVEAVIECIPVLDGISITKLKEELRKKGASKEGANDAVKIALEDNVIHAQIVKGSGHAGTIKIIYRGSDDLFSSPSEVPGS